MAQAHRGQVTFKGSDGQEFVLKFGTNAICRIQDELKMPFGKILESLKDEQSLNMSTIRTMVQMALISPANPTPEQAGDLIDDVGLSNLTKAFGGVFGADEAKDGASDPGKPSGENSA